jgi:cob(I)alamin adenosyltransferase
MSLKNNKKKQKVKNLKEGMLHIYTGNGKGKTTAALGLALRALGAGLRVFVAQFIKHGEFSEIKALKKLSKLKSFNIKIKQYGNGKFICGKPERSDIELARQAFIDVADAFKRGAYDLYILDEACCAIRCGLFSEEDLLKLIARKPSDVELIITGRDAPEKLLKKADYVTEMKCVKHPFNTKKLKARCGIEY